MLFICSEKSLSSSIVKCFENTFSHENKKSSSPFYHKNIFDRGILHSFSIKNILYGKIDLKLFYFHVTTCEGRSEGRRAIFYDIQPYAKK